MKLLLDENVPENLFEKHRIIHNVSTVRKEGWNSIKNGSLLRLMIAAGFDVLVTCDRHLCYQQNLKKYPIPIIILRARGNKIEELRLLIPQIKALLRTNLKPGPHELYINP